MAERDRGECVAPFRPEASLIVDGPLTIHRGVIDGPFDGSFTIALGYSFTGALIQVLPVTKAGAVCTVTSVKSEADSADETQLNVEYAVSDNDALAQLAYILFVTL